MVRHLSGILHPFACLPSPLSTLMQSLALILSMYLCGAREQVLLALGADPNARNNLHCPPYFVAQEWNRWETAEVLIKAMADKYVKLEPFTFPRPLRSAARRSNGSEGARGVGEKEEEEEEGGRGEDVGVGGRAGEMRMDYGSGQQRDWRRSNARSARARKAS
jgi:hypothetical protein